MEGWKLVSSGTRNVEPGANGQMMGQRDRENTGGLGVGMRASPGARLGDGRDLGNRQELPAGGEGRSKRQACFGEGQPQVHTPPGP